jgi:hypothetical protein
MRYALKNTAGDIVNYVIWDGETEWEPGSGFRVEPAPLPEPEPDDA